MRARGDLRHYCATPWRGWKVVLHSTPRERENSGAAQNFLRHYCATRFRVVEQPDLGGIAALHHDDRRPLVRCFGAMAIGGGDAALAGGGQEWRAARKAEALPNQNNRIVSPI